MIINTEETKIGSASEAGLNKYFTAKRVRI